MSELLPGQALPGPIPSGVGLPGSDAPPGADPGPVSGAASAGTAGGQVVGPLGPDVAETGHDAVDAALARLDVLATLPTEEHTAVYEDVHERLRETLAALDSRPGPPAPGRPTVPPHSRS